MLCTCLIGLAKRMPILCASATRWPISTYETLGDRVDPSLRTIANAVNA
jgi:hypothetical protein